MCAVLLSFSLQQILQEFRQNGFLYPGFCSALLQRALSSEGMRLTVPVFAALPYTVSAVNDIKSGFIKEYLPRTTVRGYITGKVIACGFSGGLLFPAGILAAYLAETLLFLPLEAFEPASGGGLWTAMSFALLRAAAPVPDLVRRLPLFFCSGMFWAVVGLLFATLTESRYMAYASPFVLYYFLVILYERYFNWLYVLYPEEWTDPSENWMFKEAGVVIFLIELTAIAALCFVMAAERRISGK